MRARFFARSTTRLACGVLLLLVAIALLADVIAPQDPFRQVLAHKNAGPSGSNWLGADLYGRDVLSRLVIATRVSLQAGLIGISVAVVGGVPAGLLSGYRGGVLDTVLGRIADSILALPSLILALAIVSVAGTGLTNAMVAVGITLAPRFFRIARAAAMSVSKETYVEAAKLDGVSPARILSKHVLPNASSAIIVQISLSFAFVIAAEASLSFLGLGTMPPTPSLGSMVREAFTQVNVSTFQIFPPIVLVTLVAFLFAVIGDALRDAVGRSQAGS